MADLTDMSGAQRIAANRAQTAAAAARRAAADFIAVLTADELGQFLAEARNAQQPQR